MLDQLIDSIENRELADRLRAFFRSSQPAPTNHPRDLVSINPIGRLKIEMYKANGEIVDTIEQDNMVTDKALAILTTILARDTSGAGHEPNVSDHTDIKTLYYTIQTYPRTLYKHEIWGPISGGFKPEKIKFVEWNHSPTPGDIEGEIPKEHSDRVSVEAEPIPLSDYWLNYIGIGDGVDYDLSVGDNAFSFNGDWSIVSNESTLLGTRAETVTTDSEVTITFTGTKLIGVFSKAPNGADVEVTIDDGVPAAPVTVSLYSETPQYRQEVVLAEGLAMEKHTATIRHTGVGFESGHSQYLLAIEGVRTNGLYSSRSSLFHEIPKKTSVISEPERYNTLTFPPYKFTLRRGNLGIVPGSETVKVGEMTLVRVTNAPSADNEYFIDYSTGEIQFARPYSGVLVTYETETEFDTGYTRSKVTKPARDSQDYPHYNLETNSVFFTADFPPGVPNFPIRVREIGLFDLPETISNASMFSIVRPSELLKDLDTGLRVTWEIRLQG